MKSKLEKADSFLKLNYSLIYDADETITPSNLIKEQLNKLIEIIEMKKTLINLKFYDPCCGTGRFLLYLFDLLMIKLINEIPNETKREKHIIENMLFGSDILEDKITMTKYFLNRNNIYKDKLVKQDFLVYNFNMKFDVIVGNPPYTKNNGKGVRTPIWHHFVEKSFSILKENGYLSFVHPDKWRWSSGYFKKKQLQDLKNKQIHYLKLGQTPFSTGALVDWYVIENTPIYKTTNVDFLDGNSDINLTFPLYSYNHEQAISKSILNKVLTTKNNKLFERQPWGGLAKLIDLTKPKGKYKFVKGISREEWKFDYSTYPHLHQFNSKVIISSMRQFRPFYDNGELGIGNNVHYLLVENENEAKFFITILKSKLGNFLQKMFLTDFWNPQSIARWNCITPFSKIKISNEDLKTDEDVYQYFKLSQEEINHIQTQIQC